MYVFCIFSGFFFGGGVGVEIHIGKDEGKGKIPSRTDQEGPEGE
jgi:hypothetical protein